MRPLLRIALTAGCLVFAAASHAIELNPGDIVVGDPGGDALFRVDPRTGQAAVISSGGFLNSTHGVAIDAAGRVIAVQDWSGGQPGKIVRVDPATGNQTALVSLSDSANPWDAIVLSGGDILFSDYGTPGRGIKRLNPQTGMITTVAQGGLMRQNLDIALSGDTLFVTDHLGLAGVMDPRILSLNLTSGAQSIVASGGLLAAPHGIALDRVSGFLYAADMGTYGANDGKVIRINPATGEQTAVSSGNLLFDPMDVAFDLEGMLLVADPRGNGPSVVVRIDPVTGAQSLVTPNPVGLDGAGIAVVVPEPVAVLPATLAIMVLGRRRR